MASPARTRDPTLPGQYRAYGLLPVTAKKYIYQNRSDCLRVLFVCLFPPLFFIVLLFKFRSFYNDVVTSILGYLDKSKITSELLSSAFSTCRLLLIQPWEKKKKKKKYSASSGKEQKISFQCICLYVCISFTRTNSNECSFNAAFSELALEVLQIGQICLILNFCTFVEQVWQQLNILCMQQVLATLENHCLNFFNYRTDIFFPFHSSFTIS